MKTFTASLLPVLLGLAFASQAAAHPPTSSGSGVQFRFFLGTPGASFYFGQGAFPAPRVFVPVYPVFPLYGIYQPYIYQPVPHGQGYRGHGKFHSPVPGFSHPHGQFHRGGVGRPMPATPPGHRHRFRFHHRR